MPEALISVSPYDVAEVVDFLDTPDGELWLHLYTLSHTKAGNTTEWWHHLTHDERRHIVDAYYADRQDLTKDHIA